MTKRILGIAVFGFVAAVAAAGCSGGGSSSGVSCSAPFTACGGDVSGQWTLAGMCFLGETTFEDCPNAVFDQTVSATGTIEFHPDNTYSANVVTMVQYDFTIPGECLPPGLSSCEQLEDDEGSDTCTGTPAEACTCTGSDTNDSDNGGSWSTSGSSITLDGNEAADYCVTGNNLTIVTFDDDGEPLSRIVLRR